MSDHSIVEIERSLKCDRFDGQLRAMGCKTWLDGADFGAVSAYLWEMTRAKPYNREAALEAAMTLFWEKGFHATSLKDLEHALQMKPGSIYAAFKSKEGLYLEALAYYGALFQDLTDRIAATSATPLVALADIIRGLVRGEGAHARRACMVVKTLLDAPLSDGPIGAAAQQQYDATRARFQALFQAAQDQGLLSPEADPQLLARRYQMALGALRIEAQRAPGAPEMLELAELQAREIEALTVAPGDRMAKPPG